MSILQKRVTSALEAIDCLDQIRGFGEAVYMGLESSNIDRDYANPLQLVLDIQRDLIKRLSVFIETMPK